MELAEKRYAQWLAQQGLEPELRQELDAMHSDACLLYTSDGLLERQLVRLVDDRIRDRRL